MFLGIAKRERQKRINFIRTGIPEMRLVVSTELSFSNQNQIKWKFDSRFLFNEHQVFEHQLYLFVCMKKFFL